MDFFQFMLIICFIVGCAFIIYSIINFHGADDNSPFDLEESLLIGHKLNEFDSSINNADIALNELNDMSQIVFKQFDEKYQELLFLYNLVDEKKQELDGMSPAPVAKPITKKMDITISDETRPGFSNQRYKEISKLKNDGMNVSEIAKTLNIGKGEVSLILELGRGRRN